jgi:SAM-dependent methyltransferase
LILKDIFGKALLDYYENHFIKNELNGDAKDIITWTNISDKDVLPLPYLFRSYKEMPQLEKKALKACKGKILDVGCGAGNHSLYLQAKGFDVKGIDVSKGAIDVCRKRGVKHVEHADILDLNEKFDSILLLMNGTGIFQSLENTYIYLRHLKSLLNPDGQILIDSTDIIYMYEDQNGVLEEDLPATYYGELDYFYSYDNEEEYPMKWLYMDFDTLQSISKEVGLDCKVLQPGSLGSYLAKLSAL